MLTLVDDTGTPYFILDEQWENGSPSTSKEVGAPRVNLALSEEDRQSYDWTIHNKWRLSLLLHLAPGDESDRHRPVNVLYRKKEVLAWPQVHVQQ